MANGRDWPNLARQVRERREELGLTQEDVAQKGGPSTATQREIERAKPMRKRASSYRNLEKALKWREGSAMRALLGGEAEPAESTGNRVAPFPRPRYADPALQHIWETPGLAEDTRRALVALARGMHMRNSSEQEAGREA